MGLVKIELMISLILARNWFKNLLPAFYLVENSTDINHEKIKILSIRRIKGFFRPTKENVILDVTF